MPILETLDLEGCVNLEEVHPSLGHCRMLTYLSLYGCHKLKKLPKFVCMGSLGTLDLFGCTRLEEFPEICGDMRHLSKLILENSPWIRSLPPSLSGLRNLQLTWCEVLESIPDTIRNLRYLKISNCNKLATLPNSLFESQLLEYLDIYQCSGLVKLPISLGVQKKLRFLTIGRCKNLKKLPSSIQMESLQQLMITNCLKLDTFPQINGDMRCLRGLTLNSTGIREVPSSIGNLSSLESLNLEGCDDRVSLPDTFRRLMNNDQLYPNKWKRLEKLPENMGDLQELYIFDAGETAIYQPPYPIIKRGKWESLVPPEDLGSLHSLRKLSLSGSNISCLPKNINKLSRVHFLNIQFCQNLNELPSGELPPNLTALCADYHLALKSIRDLVINCLKLDTLEISDCGDQANVFLQHFLRTCIQCDFHQRDYFVISFPGGRIPELFDYDRFINPKEISIDLNPSWYTDKFMGFWIFYGPSDIRYQGTRATLVCKSDPERKYSLKYNIKGYFLFGVHSFYCVYVPFETLWNNASGNKEGKNPNDYYMLEEELCWGIRLVYEEEAMSDSGHRKKKRRSNE